MRRPDEAGRDHAGFTLMETLVVLVIVGLVASLLFGGINNVLVWQRRANQVLLPGAPSVMTVDWFRRSAAMLVPDPSGGTRRFEGKADGFSAITLAPLDPLANGGPEWVVWRVAAGAPPYRTRLQYRGDDALWRDVMGWPDTGGRFLYAGRDGRWWEAWPPDMAGSPVPQIPAFIRLDVGPADAATLPTWSIVVHVTPVPLPAPPSAPRHHRRPESVRERVRRRAAQVAK